MRNFTLILLVASLASGFWVTEKYLATKPAPDWHDGELVVILPPTDSPDREFDMELASMFAEQLGVTLKPLEQAPGQAVPTLAAHWAHFSAIGMRSNEPNPLVKFAPPYQTLRELVVCNDDPPRHLKDLVMRSITVIGGSSQEAALRAAQKKMPALHWTALREKKPGELLHDVHDGLADCAITSELQLVNIRKLFPDARPALSIPSPSMLAWAFPPDGDPELFRQAQEFFHEIQQDGTLRTLLERHYGYYGYNEYLMPVDVTAFLHRTQALLPQYMSLFQEASSVTGIDWQWLAAIAYRESHWDPVATSFTGVRGMMMLTEGTAYQMNVSNRLDPRESILAGARYFQMLKDQLPLHIGEPDRTWMALAAYNQGMGHLEDARVIAQRRGLNPDSWVDVKSVLPALGNPYTREKLRYGSARGGEAGIYVETVRFYYELLQHLGRDEAPLMTPT